MIAISSAIIISIIKTSRRGRGSTFAATRLSRDEASASRHITDAMLRRLCMVFQPVCKRKSILGTEFPAFLLNGNVLQFVSDFRFLGHMVNNILSEGDDDNNCEIRNLLMRTNILVRRYMV